MRKSFFMVMICMVIAPTSAMSALGLDGSRNLIEERIINLESVSADCLPPAFSGRSIETDAQKACALKVTKRASDLTRLIKGCVEKSLSRSTCAYVAEQVDVIAPVFDRIMGTVKGRGFGSGSQKSLVETLEALDQVVNWRKPTLLSQPYQSKVSIPDGLFDSQR